MLTSYETTETQDHKETPCLAFEQMLGYVEKTLSPAKRAEAEKHLTSCELCSEAMEGFAAFPEKAKLPAMVESLNEQIEARYAAEAEGVEAEPEASLSLADRLQSVVDSIRDGLETVIDALATPRPNLRLAYVVASVFVVGFVSVLYLGKDQPNEKLFAEYYQPYPNIASSVRGELTEGKLQDALQQYDAGNFKAALKLLQEILVTEPDNAAANFYAGVSYLKVEDSERAVAGLQKVIALGDAKFSEPAAWYLALAFLQQNDLAKTRAALETITGKDHLYKEQAVNLLDRLSSSEQ